MSAAHNFPLALNGHGGAGQARSMRCVWQGRQASKVSASCLFALPYLLLHCRRFMGMRPRPEKPQKKKPRKFFGLKSATATSSGPHLRPRRILRSGVCLRSFICKIFGLLYDCFGYYSLLSCHANSPRLQLRLQLRLLLRLRPKFSA